MTDLFKKLNYKGSSKIVVLNHPESFNKEMDLMGDETVFDFEANTPEPIDFAIAFVLTREQIQNTMNLLKDKFTVDPLIWFAYPKSTSKKFKCEFNRDTGWEILGKNNFEPVRQVSIDEDWSALRFRKVDNIKTMTRSFAMTKEGKKKVSQNKN